MTAFCPDCGHEFSNVSVSSTVTAFAERIIAFDDEITAESELKKPGRGIRTILGPAIPVFFAAIRKFLFPTYRNLTKVEQKKKAYIKDFVIPDNREEIAELMMFTGDKVQNLMRMQDLVWAKIWGDKFRQLAARADVMLANDPKAMPIIKGIAEEPQKLITQIKMRQCIGRVAVAVVLVIVVGINVFKVSGAGVAVPDSVSIPPENVTITGPLGDYVQAVGNGITVNSSEGGTQINVLVELEAIKDEYPFAKEIASLIKEKGWENDKCTSEIDKYETTLKLSGIDTDTMGEFDMDRDDRDVFLNSVLRIEPGTTKKLTIPVKVNDWGSSITERKKAAAKLMSMKTMEIYIGLTYQIRNQTNYGYETLDLR
jgi:hypothetical protein